MSERWSGAEKKIARRAFDTALGRSIAGVMSEFKARAEEASSISDLWDIEDYLRTTRRELDGRFDYRYSVLVEVFADCIAEGWLEVAELEGLSDHKVEEVRRLLTWWENRATSLDDDTSAT